MKKRLIAVLASISIGALVGSGSYTFVFAHGHSYLSDDPAVCKNCHIMNEQYDGWRHGSHHGVATCNDCHLPHDSLLGGRQRSAKAEQNNQTNQRVPQCHHRYSKRSKK